jgi:hypothetical protein
VTIEKKHQNGESTVRTLVVNRGTFNDTKISVSTEYGYQKDTNKVAWLTYNYRTLWQFQGGGTLESDWFSTSASMINLYTPYSRKTISLDGNLQTLSSRGIRTVVVQIDYPFFGIHKKQQLTIHTTDTIAEKKFEITLPNDTEEIGYTITWFNTAGQTKIASGKDKTGVLFVDEIPQ